MTCVLALGLMTLLTLPEGVFSDTVGRGPDFIHGRNEPNTFTTAHIVIRPSSFQPGSGAGDYPAPYDSDAEASGTSLASPPTSMATSILRTTPVPSATSIFQYPGKYEDTLPTSFTAYFDNIRHINNEGTPDGCKGLFDSIRGALMYMFNNTQAWVHTVTVYSPRKKVVMLRVTVVTSLIFLMFSLLSLMRMHGVQGGAHHLLGHTGGTLPGGHIPLDPRRDMHHRIPPVYNPETERSYSWRDYVRDIGIWCIMTDL